MSKRALTVELTMIFGVLPLVVSIVKPHGWMALMLWALSATAWWRLQKDGYRWCKEWNRAALTKPLVKSMLRRFVPYAMAMLVFTWCIVPDHLFSLPLERPHVWVMVMLLYPLLSVIPQEIIFRSFFMKRYATIISTGSVRIANALAFGWLHIILQNWIAVVFCFIGGWLFADTYQKTHSLAAVCLEHAIYGCYVFTIGLGVFFYHGTAMH